MDPHSIAGAPDRDSGPGPGHAPNEYSSLIEFGWSPFFAAVWNARSGDGEVPARVVAVHRGAWIVRSESGESTARPSGRLRHVSEAGEIPAVGDWVALEQHGDGTGVIHEVLTRHSKVARNAAGTETKEQIVASNVDVLFVVDDIAAANLRRIERYLTVAWDGGARPVVVLNKADTMDDPAAVVAAVEAIAPAAPVHTVSAVTGAGIDSLRTYLGDHQTVALAGPSGVGKSTIVNMLAGSDVQKTREIRTDGKGRHTTTHRELILLPGGGLVLDTPGMRELQLWGAPEDPAEAFADIAALADECRFTDCAHEREPGCAVTAAVARGEITEERIESYKKLTRELHFLAVRKDKRAQSEARKKWRRRVKANRANSRPRFR